MGGMCPPGSLKRADLEERFGSLHNKEHFISAEVS